MIFSALWYGPDPSFAQIETVYSFEDWPSPSAPISKAINSTISSEMLEFAPYPISSLLEI